MEERGRVKKVGGKKFREKNFKEREERGRELRGGEGVWVLTVPSCTKPSKGSILNGSI